MEAPSDSKFMLHLDLPISSFRAEETNETALGFGMILWCKDFRRVIFDFRSSDDLEKFSQAIKDVQASHEYKRNLFCFQTLQTQGSPPEEIRQISPKNATPAQHHQQILQQQRQLILQQRQRRLSLTNGKDFESLPRTSSIERCVLFNYREELKRHGQEWSHLRHNDRIFPWRINLTANYKFQLCKNYPRALVLPTSISILSNKKLRKIAEHYIGNQLPVVVWNCFSGCSHDHPSCGSILLRATRRREIAHSDAVHATVLDALWMSLGYGRVSINLRIF